MCSPDEPDDGPVIRPSAEELLKPPQRDLLCPEPGCGRRLPQLSALRFHVQRLHRRQAVRRSDTPAAARFACPEDNCTSFSSARKTLFASLKALKQHYLKVHAPRPHVCPECGVSAFASEPLLRAHRRLCGAHHYCSCGAQFATITTLKSHAARHGHQTLVAVSATAPRPDRPRRLAPKPTPDALHLLASIALAGVPARPAPSTCDASTQTAARRAARGGRSSGTQTRLTSSAALETAAAPPRPPPVCTLRVLWPPAASTAAAGTGTATTGTATSTASAAAASLASCQTQTEASPVERLLWEAATDAEVSPDRLLANPPPPPPPSAPTAGSQTEAGTLSAETQTQDPFDVIKHLLRPGDEELLFPELSELSGTDIQTQTPWLTDDSQTQTPWLTGDSQTQTCWWKDDSQTQTPWWKDDPARLMTSQTQTAPVTHMETQTCLLCLGPCDCWGE